MGIFRGTTPQILQDLGVAGATYQITLTLTPEQIRSLNSLPVDLVVPANANTFLAPGEVVFVGAQGSGAYSSAPGPILQYSDTHALVSTLDDAASWDGSVAAVTITAAPLVEGDYSNTAQEFTSQLGLALQITSGGDVTDGDAPCTIILTFTSYDLTGLL